MNDRLELIRSDKFQVAEWRLQRIGWAVWLAVLILAACGLLGPGPMSSTETTSPNKSFAVTYDRFLHYHHPTTLRVELDELPTGSVTLRLSQELLDHVQIIRIQPEPTRRSLAQDGALYEFANSSANAPSTIVVHLEYERIGRCRGEIELVDSGTVSTNQFVYP